MNDTNAQPASSAIALEQEALTVRNEMAAVKIDSQETYDLAVAKLGEGNAFLKRAAEFFDGPINDAHQLHKRLLKQKKDVCGPVEDTQNRIKAALLAWNREQERIRRQEQHRLEEEAR
ncbi:MAG: hypothetical protein JO053_06060, partial [Acidobacteria bacterium]|nr:hypothetical protein [Acidobacteriota bacterium]